MATRTEDLETGGFGRLYVNAAGAGVAAGVVFGLLIQLGLGQMTTIGALVTFGEESLAVGWAAHLVNSLVFALVYALGTRAERVRTHASVPVTGAATGVAYGFALWFVNIGFVWPVWLNTVGVGGPPVPNLGAVGPLAGHLLWGGLMGILFAVGQRAA
jgi:hypothetical protein